jgi:predicted DCC family thiol-disulfide oxidoreductase YuxK
MAPYQKPGVPEAHGLSRAQCEAAAWAVTQDSRRYPGAAAINLALSVALGTSLPMLFYSVPGVKRVQDAAYDWVARNRGRFPGDTPYCTQHPEECR